MSKFLRSFVFAGRGVALASRGRNFRVMAGCGIVVVVAAVMVGLSPVEWAVVAGGIASVLAFESFNTAIERLADAVDSEPNSLIGEIKDLAAGASLLVSIGAAAVGVSVFGSHLW